MSKAPPINKRNVREIKVGVAETIVDDWGRTVTDDRTGRATITDASHAAGAR